MKKTTAILIILSLVLSVFIWRALENGLPVSNDDLEIQTTQAEAHPELNFKQDAIASIEATGYRNITLSDFSMAGCIREDDFGMAFQAMYGDQPVTGFVCHNDPDRWFVRSVHVEDEGNLNE